MRGRFADQGGLFSYISPEARVPASHPLRKIRGRQQHEQGWESFDTHNGVTHIRCSHARN